MTTDQDGDGDNRTDPIVELGQQFNPHVAWVVVRVSRAIRWVREVMQ